MQTNIFESLTIATATEGIIKQTKRINNNKGS